VAVATKKTDTIVTPARYLLWQDSAAHPAHPGIGSANG
jgi:hypothetical protein